MHTHFHIHRIFKIKSELHEVYLNQVIQTFAGALINIFIPIYLLVAGFDLGMVLLFEAVHVGSLGLLSPLTAKIASKLGLKHTILYRIPLYILFLFLLIIVEQIDQFLLFIALLDGFASSLYWVSLNSEFVKNTDKIHEGEEVSHMIAFPKLASIIAPTLGGAILVYLGFNTLFVLVIVLMFMSAAPLFSTREYRRYFRFKLRQTKLFADKRLALAYFANGILFLGEDLMWPLFIFVMFEDFISVGIAVSLSCIGIALFTLLIGKLSDRIDRRRIMHIGAVACAITWFARLFVTTVLEAFLLSFLGGLSLTLIMIPLFTYFCDFTKKGNILSGVVFREIWLGFFGRCLPIILLILVATKFQAAFALAGVFALVFLLI